MLNHDYITAISTMVPNVLNNSFAHVVGLPPFGTHAWRGNDMHALVAIGLLILYKLRIITVRMIDNRRESLVIHYLSLWPINDT